MLADLSGSDVRWWVPSDRRLRTVQSLSGVGFSAFLSVHLVNNAFAVLGPFAYDEVQSQVRKAYQNLYVEITGVVGCLVVHGAASCWLGYRRYSRRRGCDAVTRPPASDAAPPARVVSPLDINRYLGYVLVGASAAHVLAARLWPLLHADKADYAMVRWSLDRLPGLFHVYYAAFYSAALAHAGIGLLLSMERFGLGGSHFKRASRKVRQSAWCAGGLLVGGTLAGMAVTGGFAMHTEGLRVDRFEVFESWVPAWLPH